MMRSDESDSDDENLSEFGLVQLGNVRLDPSSILPTHLWHLVIANLPPDKVKRAMKWASKYLSLNMEDEREICVKNGCNIPSSALHNYAVEKGYPLDYASILAYTPEQSLQDISDRQCMQRNWWGPGRYPSLMTSMHDRSILLVYENVWLNANYVTLQLDTPIESEYMPPWVFRDFCPRIQITLTGLIENGNDISLSTEVGEQPSPPIMGDFKTVCGHDGQEFTISRTSFMPCLLKPDIDYEVPFKFYFYNWVVISKISVEAIWPTEADVEKKISESRAKHS